MKLLLSTFGEHFNINNPTDVYLSLDGDIIPNHGYVVISGIGSTGSTALLCHTNRPLLPGKHHSGGDWFAPDGTRVGNIGTTDVPGFERNRDPLVVRLLRTAGTGTPAKGIYQCSIMDADGNNQVVHVGLYNDGKGFKNLYFRSYELRFSHYRRHRYLCRTDSEL